MILVLGEILFDIFPDDKRLGGAPFNFAFHLKSLGFDVRFVSRVGQDESGVEILDFLEKNNFDIGDIQKDPDHATGSVHIAMHPDGSHDFSITADTAYDHMVYDERLQTLSQSDWKLFYVGSLIQRAGENAELVRKISAHKSQSSVLFCDINLRPGCFSDETIKSSLKLADILKMNEDELDHISKGKNSDSEIEGRVKQLMKKYDIKQTILTLGARGSQWFLPHTCIKSHAPDDAPVIKDTVGAGDAYAAMAAAGQLSGLLPEITMGLAGEFAGFICSIKGAIPEDVSIYKEFKRRLKR